MAVHVVTKPASHRASASAGGAGTGEAPSRSPHPVVADLQFTQEVSREHPRGGRREAASGPGTRCRLAAPAEVCVRPEREAGPRCPRGCQETGRVSGSPKYLDAVLRQDLYDEPDPAQNGVVRNRRGRGRVHADKEVQGVEVGPRESVEEVVAVSRTNHVGTSSGCMRPGTTFSSGSRNWRMPTMTQRCQLPRTSCSSWKRANAPRTCCFRVGGSRPMLPMLPSGSPGSS